MKCVQSATVSFLTSNAEAGDQRGEEDGSENLKISAHTAVAGGSAPLGKCHRQAGGSRFSSCEGHCSLEALQQATETLMIAFRISTCFKNFT